MDLVIVTGASKGLGLAICKSLLQNNYKVIAISRTKSKELSDFEKKFSDKLFYKQYDFCNTDGIHNLVKSITKEYGNIYGLINNAALGDDGILATMHESQISNLIKVNVEAPILLTKYASRSMLMKLRGRVINIGSIIASTGFNGLSVYGATKSAMTGFTKSLSRELGKAKITVNTVAPGYMQTDMTNGLDAEKLESIKRRSPLKKLVEVDDIASMVLYLLSNEANNITGSTITIDAGSTA
ncbi:MAG: SDR family oxidoreductase [Campylobacterota bacterium]|nr:SDR family oxidoreductase [Campylobacterota bacterium]